MTDPRTTFHEALLDYGSNIANTRSDELLDAARARVLALYNEAVRRGDKLLQEGIVREGVLTTERDEAVRERDDALIGRSDMRASYEAKYAEAAALREALLKWHTWAIAHPRKATVVSSLLDETANALLAPDRSTP